MADATTTPKAGSPAPDFTLPARSGRAISLREFRGKKAVLVYFYPKDDTPGCTKEACSLRDGWSQLTRRGIEVLGVSRDDAASHNAFAAKFDLPFELLTDSDHRVHEAYGAWGQSAWGVGPLRKSFLIGKDGRILHLFEKVDTEHHAEEVMKAMESSVPPGSQPPAPESKPAPPAPAPTVSEAVEKAAQAVQTAMSVATQDARKAVEKAAVVVGQKAASVKKAVKKAAKKAAKKVARKVSKKKKAAPKRKAAKKAVRRRARKAARKPARKAAKKVARKTARRKAAPKKKAAKRKKR